MRLEAALAVAEGGRAAGERGNVVCGCEVHLKSPVTFSKLKSVIITVIVIVISIRVKQ